MQSVLNQLNALPGIVGSMVYDPEGQLLARAFPALFDVDSLASAAGVLLYGVSGLEAAAGRISKLDLRFGASRLVVRPITGANLLLLCTAQANLQFLNISIGMAIPKIEKLVASQPALSLPVIPKPPSPGPQTTPGEEFKSDPNQFKGIESVFMKMDSWMRKKSGE
jgi:predicted regulator of Ras-like GTPase activity (Roadblock/LC7/MglB family)